MSAAPYPPPGASSAPKLLQRQYTGLADTFKASLSNEDDAMSPKPVSAVELTNRQAPGAVLQAIVAGVTDPGVAGKQNQDDFFVWQSHDGQTVIMAVLDGHGRELGQMAARVAKESFIRSLTSAEGLNGLRSNPKETLEGAFVTAHHAIESAFRRWYEEAGWTVTKGAGREGFLVRSKGNGQLQCVHGGTTATLVILLDGQRLIVSNVGDSTAILAGIGDAGNLAGIDTWKPMHSLKRKSPSTASGLVSTVHAPSAKTYMELSADHSPESATEFQRMHKFRPHSTLPHHPELLFVYDTLTASKLQCPPIFEVNTSSGTCTRTERGSYYKNVRCEWASLVSTPPHAAFQDALAFTRSLGDLHLQVYGVSHTPETWWMDLVVPVTEDGTGSSSTSPSSTDSHIASALESKLALTTDSSSPNPGAPIVRHPLAIVLCSDGVWDNWRFEDVASFALDKARVEKVARTGSAEAAASDLMADNLDRARVNFGSSADNMTAITLYLFPRE